MPGSVGWSLYNADYHQSKWLQETIAFDLLRCQLEYFDRLDLNSVRAVTQAPDMAISILFRLRVDLWVRSVTNVSFEGNQN